MVRIMEKSRVLSIQQPWASLIVGGHKAMETRSWATKYRGPLLIHASKKPHRGPLGFSITMTIENLIGAGDLPLGAIIGQVNLVDVITTEAVKKISMQEYELGDYSMGRYAWVLEDPVAFKTPIPAKGQLGIWYTDINLNQPI
jgi:hypothetical protein